MFKITHTTPERALRHLLRLQREGGALVSRDDVDLLEEGHWTGRLVTYLERIVTDPQMFKRLRAYEVRGLSLEEAHRGPVPFSFATHGPGIRKRIQTHLTTLASVIDQLEAHIENSDDAPNI